MYFQKYYHPRHQYHNETALGQKWIFSLSEIMELQWLELHKTTGVKA
jgi:hypothetical protein